MSVTVRHNVIRNVDGRIKYKALRSGGKEHYHLGVWIDGDDRELDQIVMVEYELHPSFKNRVKRSRNRKNGFSVTFWTWGMFNIHIRIHRQSGQVQKLDHYLKYNLPPDDGTSYVKV